MMKVQVLEVWALSQMMTMNIKKLQKVIPSPMILRIRLLRSGLNSTSCVSSGLTQRENIQRTSCQCLTMRCFAKDRRQIFVRVTRMCSTKLKMVNSWSMIRVVIMRV